MPDSFFREMSEQSKVKALLVQKYFEVWAKVIISTQKRYPHHEQRIAYIDLFAGPGRYEDGKVSTPLAVLQLAIEDEDIRQRLVTLFNDQDADKTDSLREAISDLPGIDTLHYEPIIWNEEVGEEITDLLESMNLVPTLFFVDPWGYKGLSLRLINAVMKHFGCDCIFFFNFNRINMGINNEFVRHHMEALFGDSRVAEMRRQMEGMTPTERELYVVNEISEALREMGGKLVLPFTFKNANGSRTSHHLIFVSKHVRGYEKMKEIMARHSSTVEQGVASFDFTPTNNEQYPLLFELSRPLDELGDMLTKQYAGRTLKMIDIYDDHHVGTPYIKKNYKTILNALEEQGRIECNPPAAQRRMQNGERTFADRVLVTFPII